MAVLFTELKLRDVVFRNRIFVSPMCQYSATDGVPNTWHLVHLGSRAVGGAALVMVEASAVSPEGRITPHDLGIWSQQQLEGFVPIVQFIKQQGVVPAIQISHAGRKASVDVPWRGGGPLSSTADGWQPLAPSALPQTPAHTTPQAMTASDIDRVTRQFADAAVRARSAGFEVIEIHMAHGYLLHEFLSPVSNQRHDEFGASPEHRARFPLQVARAVREIWPEHLPVFVRISATDWVEGGWDLEQSVQLATWLTQIGVDLIDCSSGGLTVDADIPAEPGFQAPFAAAIRERAPLATGVVGLITQANQAERFIATGQADAVLLARELLRDPYWPLHAAQQLDVDIPWPVQYQRAKPAY